MKIRNYTNWGTDILAEVGEHKIRINGGEVSFSFLSIENNYVLVKIDEKPYKVYINKDKSVFDIYTQGVYFRLRLKNKITEYQEKIAEAEKKGGREHHVISPMPGLVTKIVRQKGDQVQAGDTVLFLEAMKMENAIKCFYSGVIEDIYVEENKNIEKGIPLFAVK